MDIVYYRKCAEIMLRDGSTYEDRKIAARLLETRNPKRRDKKLVKAWMYRWIDRMTGGIAPP